MPTRKIDDSDDREQRCRHPEHEPPSMMVYPPGLYEHECPGCHRKIRFRSETPTLGGGAVMAKSKPGCQVSVRAATRDRVRDAARKRGQTVPQLVDAALQADPDLWRALFPEQAR